MSLACAACGVLERGLVRVRKQVGRTPACPERPTSDFGVECSCSTAASSRTRNMAPTLANQLKIHMCVPLKGSKATAG